MRSMRAWVVLLSCFGREPQEIPPHPDEAYLPPVAVSRAPIVLLRPRALFLTTPQWFLDHSQCWNLAFFDA